MSPDDQGALQRVREVADAVLYEGYLLYPYRASSAKNQSRWQFGVLGPPGAARDGLGEEPGMSMQCLLATPRGSRGRDTGGTARVTVHLRCLQLQVREVQRGDGRTAYRPVRELTVDGASLLSWDEAVEREVRLAPQPVAEPLDAAVEIPGGEDHEAVRDATGQVVGRILRRRRPLLARVRMQAERDAGLIRLTVSVTNEHAGPVADKTSAIAGSLIGAHLIVQADGAYFVSVIDPPGEAVDAAARCRQQRCWPVLAGAPGSTDVVLGAPIILYDHPQIAEQSHGALFDATEIDEILTLRVMTMTEQEKAEARATDPRAREIIERCDAMTVTELQQLHGILRDPEPAPAQTFDTGDVPWWDPATDAQVDPGSDAVVIEGVEVKKGSLVRVHPSRRADAQDLFFADQVARVSAVLHDVDGAIHVALVLLDDPAADLHEEYGRYFYFAPDELKPLTAQQPSDREESHP